MARARPPELSGEPSTGDVLDTPAAGPAAIRGSALRAGGYAAGVLLTLISVPFLVRHLGVVDFGRFVLVTSLITLVAGLTESGLAAVALREYAVRPPAQRRALMRNLIGVRVALTAAGVAVAVGFTLVAGYDRTLVLGTVLAGFALVAQSLQLLIAVPLAADLRYGWATVADLLRQMIVVVLTLALVVAGAELLPFFVIAIPAALASLVVTAILVRRVISFRPTLDWEQWWMLVRDSLPYAAAVAINVAYFRIAIVLMSLVATRVEIGYFATSFRILEVLLPIPALAVGAAFPILARAAIDDRERLRYATQRILEVGLIAGAGLVLLVVIAAPLILDVLAGDQGEPSVAVLRIQAPALLASFIVVGCGYSLLSVRRHGAILGANLVALGLSVALTLALAPSLGAKGAAIATVSAEFALAAVLLGLLVRSADGLRLSWTAVGPVLLATGAGGAMWLLPVPLLVHAALAAVAYLGVLVALRAIPPELMQGLRRRPADAPTAPH